jgi:hypothetical protein
MSIRLPILLLDILSSFVHPFTSGLGRELIMYLQNSCHGEIQEKSGKISGYSCKINGQSVRYADAHVVVPVCVALATP